MNTRLTVVAATAALSLFVAMPAHAWKQETHRRIVLDAAAFMKNNPGITNYDKLAAGVARAGYTVDQFA